MSEINEAERKEIERYCDRQDRMAVERANFESQWQECMDYIVPRKNDIISVSSPGTKKGSELFDTTAIMSNQLLAGALHSMLTNQTSQFFDLAMSDSQFDDDEEVKAWLQEVTSIMHSAINASNFQTEVHEIYLDLGGIGTACMFISENERTVFNFAARSMKEIFAQENNLGLIDTVHRVFDWKARQIIQEFGEKNVPECVLKRYQNGSDDPFKIIHVVEPEDPGKTTYFGFKSLYILKEEKQKLNQGGFKEFPFVVPRWTKTSGETYGRGPGMDMLPDIKMVNVMMETTIKGAQLTVAPPLMVPDDGVIGKVRMTPHGLTVVRQGFEISPLITNARIDFGYQVVEDTRKRIRSGFYVDQLQLNEGPQMTATEVNQRTEEKLRLMGPVLGRQHFEFLRPMVERIFGIMNRKGLIPKPPEQIAGKRFDVRYSSLIAKAQKMSEGANLTRAITAAAPIINAMPETLDCINGDTSLKYIFDIYGVPQKLMNSSRDIDKKREARAEAQQQVMQQQQQQHQADMVAKIGPTAVQAEREAV